MHGIQLSSAALATLLLATPALAVDGVIEINQSRADAGGVTAGDTAGFPVTIGAAGSYRLSGNLQLFDADVDAIQVTAADVTIDLNGFSIIGPATCTGIPPATVTCTPQNSTASGIDATSIPGLTVRDGAIRGMPNGAIVCGRRCHIQRVTASANGHSGFELNGGGIVERSTAAGNADVGIITLAGSTGSWGSLLIDNTAVANGQHGISIGLGDNVVGNIVSGNGGFGISGHTGRVAGNIVFANAFDGINLFVGLVEGNQVRENLDHGLGVALTTVGVLRNAMSANGSGDLDGAPLQLGPNACGGGACP